jgi:hypothetical protein
MKDDHRFVAPFDDRTLRQELRLIYAEFAIRVDIIVPAFHEPNFPETMDIVHGIISPLRMHISTLIPVISSFVVSACFVGQTERRMQLTRQRRLAEQPGLLGPVDVRQIAQAVQPSNPQCVRNASVAM